MDRYTALASLYHNGLNRLGVPALRVETWRHRQQGQPYSLIKLIFPLVGPRCGTSGPRCWEHCVCRVQAKVLDIHLWLADRAEVLGFRDSCRFRRHPRYYPDCWSLVLDFEEV